VLFKVPLKFDVQFTGVPGWENKQLLFACSLAFYFLSFWLVFNERHKKGAASL